MPKQTTVTFPEDELNEVCNLLQLIAVCGVQLWIQGIAQPNKTLIMAAFDRMCRASMPALDMDAMLEQARQETKSVACQERAGERIDNDLMEFRMI